MCSTKTPSEDIFQSRGILLAFPFGLWFRASAVQCIHKYCIPTLTHILGNAQWAWWNKSMHQLAIKVRISAQGLLIESFEENVLPRLGCITIYKLFWSVVLYPPLSGSTNAPPHLHMFSHQDGEQGTFLSTKGQIQSSPPFLQGFVSFLDAIAFPNSYPCQSVGQWVSEW